MRKYQSLQVLRAIAAWLVVSNHYMQMYFNYQYDNLLSQLVVARGSFGIDLFFVLSGFVMFLTSQRPGVTGANFFVKRVMRIIPAYWFFTTMILVWIVLFPRIYAYTDYNLASLFKSYLLIPGENPSGIGLLPVLTPGWTLIYEFTFYSILAGCILVSRKYALWLCFVIIFLSPLLFPDGLTYSPILASWTIWQFLAGFLIGWYTQSPLFERINNSIPLWVQCTVLLVAALLLFTGITGYSLIQRTLVAGLIVQTAILIDQKANYSSRFAKFMVRSGDYSYSVYLCHVLVIGAYLHFTSPWLPWYLDLAVIIAITVTTHFVAKSSYRFIEQGKLTKAVRRSLFNLAERMNSAKSSDLTIEGKQQ